MSLSNILKTFAALLAILTVSVHSLHAVPVYPKPITVTQADGTTLTVRLYGDERFTYATTTDGYNIVNHKGVYYYATTQGSRLVSTGIPAKDPARRTAEDRKALSAVGYGAPYGVIAAARSYATLSPYSFGASPVAEGDVYQQRMADMRSSGEEFRSLVILVQFPDQTFSVPDPRSAFDRLLNEEGYSDNSATGSARDYYVDNSNGKFNPHFDVAGPFTLSKGVFDYTGIEGEFIIESCNLAEANGVDFSRYVDDGVLRDVFIFFAGYNNAEAAGGYLHPARMFFSNPNVSFGTWGGGRLLAAAYTSELKGAAGTTMAGIGTFCHEFGHILGWPDFYDTDYAQNGTGFNLDVFSLMASGSYVNQGRTPPAVSAYERNMVGWASLTEITEAGEYTLEPVYNDKSYMIKTFNEDEFFVFEYRDGALNKWDRFLQTGDNQPGTGYPIEGSGSGMLVYHIDRSGNRVGSYSARDLWGLNANKVNAYGDHECLRLVMASPIERKGYVLTDFGKMFFPGTANVTEFTSSYPPLFVGWDGYTAGMELYNITKNGTSNVTFEVKPVVSGTIKDLQVIPSQFDITVSFISPFKESYRIVCREENGKEFSVSTLDRTVNFTGLKPATKYEVSIYYEEEEEPREVTEVTTLPIEQDKLPVLNLENAYRPGEMIILQYLNIKSEVSSVEWSVNGKAVEGTVIKLSVPDSYKIMAKVVTAEGVEYMVKYITIA